MYDFIQSLIEFVRSTNMFATVGVYRNEFLNEEWNPSFPACLIRMEQALTTATFSDADSGAHRLTVILYVANRFNPALDTNDALSLAEYLFGELHNKVDEESNYRISPDRINFVETGSGIDVYSITINVQ